MGVGSERRIFDPLSLAGGLAAESVSCRDSSPETVKSRSLDSTNWAGSHGRGGAAADSALPFPQLGAKGQRRGVAGAPQPVPPCLRATSAYSIRRIFGRARDLRAAGLTRVDPE